MSEQEKICRLLRKGELLQIEEILSNQKEWSSNLIILNLLIQVFRREVKNNIAPTIFDYSLELDELTKHFIHLKLLIRRIEFDLPTEYQQEFYNYCINTGSSIFLILSIIQNNIFGKEKTCRQIAHIFENAEGNDSEQAVFFHAVAG